MTIRPYSESDRQDVVALWREVFPNNPWWNDPDKDIDRKCAVQPELFFVAFEGDHIIGTVMAGYEGHRGWINYVAVAPDSRQRGIGTALMHHAEDALRAAGCPKINLQVRTSNTAVIEFYRGLGYDVDEVVSMGKRLVSRQDATD